MLVCREYSEELVPTASISAAFLPGLGRTVGCNSGSSVFQAAGSIESDRGGRRRVER